MLRRLFRRSAIALVAGLPAGSFAQSKFEGLVTISLASPQGPTDMTYSIKGDQFRMDMSGMGGMSMYVLHSGSTNANLMVIPSQRMYMETPQFQGMGEQAGAPAKKVDIKVTGRRETIAGYECEHVILTNDDGTQHDVCQAKGLGTFIMPRNPMGRGGRGSSAAWERLGGDFFPLKVQQVGGDVVFQVTKIEKKALDESLFKIPADYQKMDLGGMMRRPPA